MSLTKIAAKWGEIFKMMKDPRLSHAGKDAFERELLALAGKQRAYDLHAMGRSLYHAGKGKYKEMGYKMYFGTDHLVKPKRFTVDYINRANRLKKMLGLAERKGFELGVPRSKMEKIIANGRRYTDEMVREHHGMPSYLRSELKKGGKI